MDKKVKSVGKITGAALVVIVLVVLLSSSITKVPVGHTGILLTFGKVQDTPLDEGVHFKIPFAQQVVAMDNRIQKLEVETEAFSKDIQTVNAVLALNYQVEREKTFSLYREIGVNFESTIIIPATHEALKSATSKYTAEELVAERKFLADSVVELLNEELNSIGVKVTAFNIVDFYFSEEYKTAIEDKQVAEQRKKKAEIENQTSVEKAKAEAERATIQAQAEADAAIIRSEGKAEQLRVEAEGRAESYRMQNEQIRDVNILMEWIDKWNGKLPTVQAGEDAGFMFNLQDLENIDDSPPVQPAAETQNTDSNEAGTENIETADGTANTNN